MPDPITLNVNGAQYTVRAEPDTPLLYILRNDLKLKGAKFGCGLGQCGACMVLIDGHNVMSCDTPLWAAAGKAITTIEALGTLDAPGVLQRAFIAEQAAQCGYCANGMVMKSVALLAEHPKPTQDEVKAALAGNLCRCGTQPRVLRAVARAAGSSNT